MDKNHLLFNYISFFKYLKSINTFISSKQKGFVLLE